ncbi:MAG: amidophosphoribosyltransferase [Firmicutes bacterium]|nr:amidophosphoribosyltransferase [Bacillota bacterium]
MSYLHEECGVFGVWSPVTADLASEVYYGLFALQHRGQESCGIAVNDDGVFRSYKDLGLVGDVFTHERLASLGPGNIALGHVRYSASAQADQRNSLPLVVNHVKGNLAISINGSLANYRELRQELELQGALFHTGCDCEVIANLVIRERLQAPSIEEAVSRAMGRLEGAYSMVIMTPGKLLAVRDPHGFRPLCYGEREDGSWVVASESCALDAADARLIDDVAPGQIIVFDKDGRRILNDHCGDCPHSMCVFEFVYFARPDSIVDGSSVHIARQRAGAYLALDHPVDADVVIGVPDSGLDAAIGYARQSGIPYGIGLLKNKYIGRTFIAPQQSEREDKVRIKLNPVSATIKGKRVVLVDDSIVRGTTCARIVRLLREAGAKEVHMRVSAPPFLNPCYYGTDISDREVLLAHNRTVAEMEKIVGVDSLGFISIPDVKKIAERCRCNGFCTACFDNNYPTAIPEEGHRSKYDKKISEKK